MYRIDMGLSYLLKEKMDERQTVILHSLETAFLLPKATYRNATKKCKNSPCSFRPAINRKQTLPAITSHKAGFALFFLFFISQNRLLCIVLSGLYTSIFKAARSVDKRKRAKFFTPADWLVYAPNTRP
jgi:hypothetical protein